MESVEALFTSLDLDELPSCRNDTGDHGRRLCTTGCGRPVNVCLCEKMPSEPISTATEIVILHHPHEQRHKLATVPVLIKCLKNCETLVGRRIRHGSSPLLDSLHSEAVRNPGQPHRAVFLFPGTASMPSLEINKWMSSLNGTYENNCVLIVFDGTWKHAKEMMNASLPFLSNFATCVCFNYDVEVSGGSMYDSGLVLRKEPFAGCMSTIEAVARALRVLEPSGLFIEEKLIDVLKAMVQLQACHLKPMKPRPEVLKLQRDAGRGYSS